nr:MAG TPA: hypothetical protein [Caudoviricetes sp.]
MVLAGLYFSKYQNRQTRGDETWPERRTRE